jgi:hypothetical protein
MQLGRHASINQGHRLHERFAGAEGVDFGGGRFEDAGGEPPSLGRHDVHGSVVSGPAKWPVAQYVSDLEAAVRNA